MGAAVEVPEHSRFKNRHSLTKILESLSLTRVSTGFVWQTGKNAR